jgi:hypothetical protein
VLARLCQPVGVVAMAARLKLPFASGKISSCSKFQFLEQFGPAQVSHVHVSGGPCTLVADLHRILEVPASRRVRAVRILNDAVSRHVIGLREASIITGAQEEAAGFRATGIIRQQIRNFEGEDAVRTQNIILGSI